MGHQGANGRCSLHGGRSAGPKTEDGLAQLTAVRTTHGKYTKEKRAEAKRRAEVGRQMRACFVARIRDVN